MKPWSRLAHSCRSLSPVSAARSISTPPGRDANPSQVIPSNLLGFPQKFAGTHLYSWVERGTVRVKCPRTQHSEPGPLGLGMSTLTMRPTCLHKRKSQLKWGERNYVLPITWKTSIAFHVEKVRTFWYRFQSMYTEGIYVHHLAS